MYLQKGDPSAEDLKGGREKHWCWTRQLSLPLAGFYNKLVSVVDIDMDASGSFTGMSLSHSSPPFDSFSSTSVHTQSTWDHGLASCRAFLHSEVLLRRAINFSLGSSKCHLAK